MPARGKPRTPLAERVYHILYSRISNGDYLANQKLPPETKLSGEFGVSRPVLRVALERLREEGLLYSRQGAGSYVKPMASAALGFSRIESLADVQRCYEYRITLESQSAYLAAQRCNEAVLSDLEAALESLRSSSEIESERESADYAFHYAVAVGANNRYFESTLTALREHIYVGMQAHVKALMTDSITSLKDVFTEHESIYEAIRTRHAEQASDRMRAHLEQSRKRLFGESLLDLRLP